MEIPSMTQEEATLQLLAASDLDDAEETASAPTQEAAAPEKEPDAPAAETDGDGKEGSEDPYLELAQEMGYKADFDGPNKLSPKDFILREREFTKKYREELGLTRAELDALKKQVDTIRETHTTAKTQELDEQIQALVKDRKYAIEEGDVDAVEAFDKKIDALREQKRTATPPPAEKKSDPAPGSGNAVFDAWHKGNAWYKTDAEATEWAELRAAELEKRGYSAVAIFDTLSREHSLKFPASDASGNGNPPPPRASAAGSGHKPTAQNGKTWSRQAIQSLPNGSDLINALNWSVEQGLSEKEWVSEMVQKGILK